MTAFLSVLFFWIAATAICLFLLVLFVLIVVLTGLIWTWQQVMHPQSAKISKHVAKEKALPLLTEIVITKVPKMGLLQNQTWCVYSLHASDSDTKPHLLLIHGTNSCALSWIKIIPALTKTFQILAIDLPGFGDSPTPIGLDDMPIAQAQACMVDLLYAWLNAMQIKTKIIVLGHSYGAYLAIQLASKYPHIVQRLLLADPVGILPTLSKYGAYWAVFFKLAPIQSFLQKLGSFGAWMVHTWLVAARAKAKRHYWWHLFSDTTAIGHKLVAKNIYLNWTTGQAIWFTPVFNDLINVQCPVAFIYGETDTITPLHQGRVLANVLGPNIPCIKLDGVGHMFLDANANVVVDVINTAYEIAGHVKTTKTIHVKTILQFMSNWNIVDTQKRITDMYTHLQTKINT
jgi:pimeloyl-ACP methyl ester carboxylesterase